MCTSSPSLARARPSYLNLGPGRPGRPTPTASSTGRGAQEDKGPGADVCQHCRVRASIFTVDIESPGRR